jgi:hypothetical protein
LVVLAVNIGDSKAKYQEFVKSHRYSHLQWARDSSGEVSDMYQVRGIPLTYILDQEGVIRYAHVGYGDGMATTLAEEIESLLK